MLEVLFAVPKDCCVATVLGTLFLAVVGTVFGFSAGLGIGLVACGAGVGFATSSGLLTGRAGIDTDVVVDAELLVGDLFFTRILLDLDASSSANESPPELSASSELSSLEDTELCRFARLFANF